MKVLYVIGIMHVYAQGQNKVIFLSGGDLISGAKLVTTAPELGTAHAKAISKGSNQTTMQARANLWFANDGARFTQALNQASTRLSEKLKNYLTGHRAASSPYKS